MMTTRGKGIAAVGLVALLMLLGACGRGAEAPRQQPPLTLPSGPSSSALAGDGGDWTTYHRDNARTGYLPGLADPHRLTPAWSSRLDGAVYGEPLVVGVDARSGQVRVRRSADPSGIDPRPHQQRAALALSQGKVYVAYGGLFGDCGDYRGRVVASRTDGRGPLDAYPTWPRWGRCCSTLYVPCTDGLRQVMAGPGGRLEPGWRAPGNVNGSPVVGGHTVYTVDAGGGVLYALDDDQGMVRASARVGQTSRFATPALAGGLVLVGTLNGVTALAAR